MQKLDKAAECPVNSSDEIGTLAANINTLYSSLLSTIEHLETEKKNACEAEQAKIDFLRAASHELKTPVTALNASLENMILGISKYKNRDVCLVECKEITERLASMIKEVLDTSGLDFTQEKQKAENFNLSAVLPDLCEPYQLIAKAKQIRFHLEIQEECPVHLSKRSLEKLLSNVFSNAVSYTMPENHISIVLSASRITIENECLPIKAEDVPRLFEPFYRPDFARDRKFGGNGLGLYIVDTLADALGLRYTFAPMDSPQGMKFTLYFH